jgi:hypothetical protein
MRTQKIAITVLVMGVNRGLLVSGLAPGTSSNSEIQEAVVVGLGTKRLEQNEQGG